jgi:SmpA / OmlA family
MQFRIYRWSWLLLPLLTACSSYAPPANLSNITKDELIAKMGVPDKVRQTNEGTRLEFPRGPMGKHTWFVYFDAAGRAIRSEQVLTEQNFNRISPGMAQEEVSQLLGRPGEVQGLGRSRGEVWSYRYENHHCQWFQVELTLEQQVRSTGYGQPPECMGGKDIIMSLR